MLTFLCWMSNFSPLMLGANVNLQLLVAEVNDANVNPFMLGANVYQ